MIDRRANSRRADKARQDFWAMKAEESIRAENLVLTYQGYEPREAMKPKLYLVTETRS